MEIVCRHRFDVPSTLITTDPDAARRFWTDSGAVIYKSTSGVRSVVARLGDAHVERLDDVIWCPTQFQRYVPGRDHRVHVVGDDVFACEVISEADDYRYAARHGAPPALRACTLPVDVAGASASRFSRPAPCPFPSRGSICEGRPTGGGSASR